MTKENRIVRIAGTQPGPTAPTTGWKTINHFSLDQRAFGGIAILNIGPRYDPNTLAGQLRILYVNQGGEIRHLNSLKDVFYAGTTGFKAAPGSDLSLGVKRDATGQTTDISLTYVDAKGGLKEILVDEKNNRNEYKAGKTFSRFHVLTFLYLLLFCKWTALADASIRQSGRTVDPYFPTTFAGHFTSVYGGPPPISRVYTLNPNAPGERRAGLGEEYTQSWWQTADDKFYYPEHTGASVAAVSWADKEVRVIYKSKASNRKLVEVGLSDQGPGAGVKWFGRGFFN